MPIRGSLCIRALNVHCSQSLGPVRGVWTRYDLVLVLFDPNPIDWAQRWGLFGALDRGGACQAGALAAIAGPSFQLLRSGGSLPGELGRRGRDGGRTIALRRWSARLAGLTMQSGLAGQWPPCRLSPLYTTRFCSDEVSVRRAPASLGPCPRRPG